MEFLLHHKLKMIESKLKFKIKYFVEFCGTFMTALYRSSLKLSTDWVVADTQYYVATLLQYSLQNFLLCWEGIESFVLTCPVLGSQHQVRKVSE